RPTAGAGRARGGRCVRRSTPAAPLIRVLIVDDDARFLLALRALLEADPRLEVVGDAANGNAAIRLVAELKPDLVTTDLAMPVTSGAEATDVIMRSAFACPIIVVSGSESNEMLAAALAAGAVAHVSKANAAKTLIPAIIAAAARESEAA